MKIKRIILKNFKGIPQVDLELDGRSTILFGINGVGKSTILRAIDLIYANIIWKLTRTSKKMADLQGDEISYGKARASIYIEFEFTNQEVLGYGRTISRSRGKEHNEDELKKIVNLYQELYIEEPYEDEEGNWIEEDLKNMPIFVNYGVNRQVSKILVRASRKRFSKLSAFSHAIESEISFRELFTWFRNQEDIENQEKVRKDRDYEDVSLKAVKKAMLGMLDGFEDIHIDRHPLCMKVKKDGRYYKISQLSDGEKCVIALFGDLARRLALANPTLENPLEGIGVVLIDEIDLHMHTSWQRKVMSVLEATFPNIQFIVTTHSPQILGEISSDYNLFYLQRDEQSEIVFNKIYSLVGWDSNVILEELMHTSSLNSEVKCIRTKLYDLINNKEYDQAEQIADELDRLTNGRIEGVSRARMLISRGRRNEKNNKEHA